MPVSRYKKSEHIQSRILDKAEELFAKQGFEATTTRQITSEIGVRNASVNYFFKTKHALGVAVIDRRFSVLKEARLARLEKVDFDTSNQQDQLGQVIEAFIVPLAEFSQSADTGWRNYNRIMAQIAASGDWPEDDYVQIVNDMAMRFIHAFQAIFPAISKTQAFRGYQFMLGTVLFAFAEGSRFIQMAEADEDLENRFHDPCMLLNFVEAGLFRIFNDPS